MPSCKLDLGAEGWDCGKPAGKKGFCEHPSPITNFSSCLETSHHQGLATVNARVQVSFVFQRNTIP